MNHNTPVSRRPLAHLADAQQRVLSAAQLPYARHVRRQGAAQCRPGGPWQQILPGVFVLHPGPPSARSGCTATLLYAGRPPADAVVPAQARAEGGTDPYGDVMVTGPAALALHHFRAAPPLFSLDRIVVLAPRTRRLRSTGCARLVRVHTMPRAQQIGGVPVAPVARALADTGATSVTPMPYGSCSPRPCADSTANPRRWSGS